MIQVLSSTSRDSPAWHAARAAGLHRVLDPQSRRACLSQRAVGEPASHSERPASLPVTVIYLRPGRRAQPSDLAARAAARPSCGAGPHTGTVLAETYKTLRLALTGACDPGSAVSGGPAAGSP